MTQTSASDRKSIREAEKAAAEWDRLSAEVVTGLMSNTAGRRWIWERLSEAHVFATTMRDEFHWTAFAEGRRSLGLDLLNTITSICPDLFILAMRESHERHAIDTSRNLDTSADDPNDPGGLGAEFDRLYPNANDALLNS